MTVESIAARAATSSNGSGKDLERGISAANQNQNSLDPAGSDADPWKLPQFTSTDEKWQDLDTKGKVTRVGLALLRILALLALLYFFVCSLDLLSVAFRLLGGRATGEIFQKNELLQNPVVGVMIGILTTVLVQSSSTSTSIIVSMVAANLLTVPVAIPIVMGANIGTSMTNTIVSLTQIGDRDEFRRAFAAATVHDMFNWLTVSVLFVVEITTKSIFGQGYLEIASEAATRHIQFSTTDAGNVKLLSALTDPLTSRIVQLDKRVIEAWSRNDSAYFNASLIKTCREMVHTSSHSYTSCSSSLFESAGLADWVVGVILLIVSLLVLCGCLVGIVKVLNSMLQGQMAHVIRKVINAKVPHIPWATGYLAILVGALMTFLVQSSSVFTSALTPLVGVGVISLERVYPLTLGSNIGTTTTSLLAALAADAQSIRYTLQISLCHLFFNITGILLFYPIPASRFPIPLAKFLGDTTAKYRWFSIAYLLVMFFLLPAIVLGLSLAGSIALAVVGIPTVLLLTFVAVISCLQSKKPEFLPRFLQDWNFLPTWLRSLEPWDRQLEKLLRHLPCCTNCRNTKDNFASDCVKMSELHSTSSGGVVNAAFK